MMDQVRRDLIHTAMDGELAVLPIFHQLSHYRSCDNFLKWLIANRIIGQTLLDWLKIEHSNSVMAMVQFIVKNCNKDRNIRPIILNKDWLK